MTGSDSENTTALAAALSRRYELELELYRSAVARARGEMMQALDAVAASVRSQTLFGAPAPPRRSPQLRGRGDGTFIVG